MRSLLAALAILAALTVTACFGTVPLTMRQQNHHDTSAYTNCQQVQVDCADEACSNMKDHGWNATACGQRYHCTRAAGQVVCAPIES